MAQETLDRIKQSELAAKQRIKEAQDESVGIISAAREEARQYRDNVVSDAKSTAKLTLERAKEALEPSLEAAGDRANAVVSQMQKSFDRNKSDAVKMIIEHILDIKEA